MRTKHKTTLFKRLGAWALTLALVVGLLPQTAFAAGTGEDTQAHENHPVCGASCQHNGSHTAVTWTAWNETTSLPTDQGSYYLAADVTIQQAWTPPENTVLCLNGHTISLAAEATGSVITTR